MMDLHNNNRTIGDALEKPARKTKFPCVCVQHKHKKRWPKTLRQPRQQEYFQRWQWPLLPQPLSWTPSVCKSLFQICRLLSKSGFLRYTLNTRIIFSLTRQKLELTTDILFPAILLVEYLELFSGGGMQMHSEEKRQS